MHDLVICNGTVLDGTDAPGFRGDVAIDGHRISALGKVSETAGCTLDAEGRIVTPAHVGPGGSPACWHGTTTVVVGNCGVTFAPVREGRELRSP